MKQFFGVAIIAFLGLGMFFVTEKSPTNVSDGYTIGDAVEDFSLKNTEGETVSLKGYLEKEGVKGVVVIFTCNTCPYAVAYEDRIIGLHDEYSAKGYPVLAINPNDPSMKAGDSFEKMKQRSAEKGFTFDYTMDETQEVFKKFGATKTPHVYLVDSDMKVRYIGAIDNNATDPAGVTTKYLENAIMSVDQGKDPDPLTTKAVGCSIKYKKGA